MKENRYDDPLFFEKYSQMSRSRLGLAGAGEWEDLQKLLPDFAGKQVLDLGCGYGWHCAYAAEHGAAHVTGVDAIEDVDFPPESFDVVFSSLAIHYLQDFSALAEKVRTWLKPGGDFVFSVEHPIFTAYGSQDWYYDEAGNILHFPVDNYFYEGQRQAVFLGEDVVKYHRTLTPGGGRGEVPPHPHHLSGYLAHRRLCLAPRGGGQAPGKDAGHPRHEGRAAPPHDAAGGRSKAVKEAAPWMATPR